MTAPTTTTPTIPKPIWYVWKRGGAAPSHEHTSLASAIEEEKRLARNMQGSEFVVLRGAALPCGPR